MAGVAGSWEPCRHVVRVIRVLIVGLVAPVTSGGQVSVVVVDVAIGASARRHRVGPG